MILRSRCCRLSFQEDAGGAGTGDGLITLISPFQYPGTNGRSTSEVEILSEVSVAMLTGVSDEMGERSRS